MAENILSEFSRDFLECTIYLHPFKDPKMLPCLHTFCKGCLETFVVQQSQGKDKFPCPTCRAETVLPKAGVAGFKDNSFVVNLSGTVKAHESLASKEDNKVSCDLCEEEVAVQGCVPCEEFLCEECACAHRRFKRTRGHEVVSVAELKERLIAKMSSFKSRSLPPICPKHQDERLKFYCETCKSPICRDCTVLQHKDHKCGYLADAATDVRAKIKDKLEAAMRKIAANQDVSSVIAKKQSELDSKSKKAADDIDVAAEEEIKCLRHKQAELKEKLAAVTTARSKQLSTVADSVASTVGCLSSTVDFSQKVVEHGSDFDIMNVCSDVTARLDPLLKGPASSIPDCSDVAFVPKNKKGRKGEEVVLGNIAGEELLEEEEEGSQAGATFRLTVEKFSQVKQKEEKYSHTVFIRNLPWKLLVKREHDRRALPKEKKTLGVYLHCDAEADVPWYCDASAELRLIPQKDGVKMFKKVIDKPFFSKLRSWGYLDFMPLYEVCNPQKGYIKDDKIVLEAYVKARTPRSGAGILRNIVGEEMSQAEATFGFTVDKFDFSNDWEQLSPVVFIRNMPWKMAVQRNVFDEEKPRFKSLGVFLQCDADSSSLWSCKAAFELRLVSQKDGVQNLTRNIQHVFYNKGNNQGVRHFIPWDVARDPEKGYIKDNKFIFEAYVKADTPRIMI